MPRRLKHPRAVSQPQVLATVTEHRTSSLNGKTITSERPLHRKHLPSVKPGCGIAHALAGASAWAPELAIERRSPQKLSLLLGTQLTKLRIPALQYVAMLPALVQKDVWPSVSNLRAQMDLETYDVCMYVVAKDKSRA